MSDDLKQILRDSGVQGLKDKIIEKKRQQLNKRKIKDKERYSGGVKEMKEEVKKKFKSASQIRDQYILGDLSFYSSQKKSSEVMIGSSSNEKEMSIRELQFQNKLAEFN